MMTSTEIDRAPPLPDDHPVLQRYLAGEASAEITLMQLLFSCGGFAPLFAALNRLGGRPEFASLLHVAAANRNGLERTAALIASGIAEERTDIDAIREQFDRAVTFAPEASVALYSLGTGATLDRASAEIVERLREWRLIAPARTVLDVGCGIGRMERALAAEVAAITGIDLSAGMVAEARRRCSALTNVTLRQCSGTDLSEFEDESFDLVLAVDSFPYLVAAGAAIVDRHVADAVRLLRPGGALAILNFSYRGELAADRDEVARLAARHGFAVERDGARDFLVWDGATFLLRKPAGVNVPRRRG